MILALNKANEMYSSLYKLAYETIYLFIQINIKIRISIKIRIFMFDFVLFFGPKSKVPMSARYSFLITALHVRNILFECSYC